ncbi:30S ribosomal protein S4 [Murdochiella massiliensis]|uniref:30S ribosomal protein S4 n=1 Tax=Murdochiella massiliensis TaxID=1673723 RepID=UPI000835FE30|nr:30S ribosomal protein S4 [Murdochiella massiliensis]MBY0584021.1 30S ribosomal protein S4 [Murdochiella sp. Marseille-P8839]
MARYTGPILKRCRALGIEPQVVGIDKKSRRNPKRNTRKLSDYGMQLREKQKAKFIYGVSEKSFRNLFSRATRMSGQAGWNLLKLLELRFDNVVYRMGFASTRAQARQLIVHGHFDLNGHKATVPSMTLEVGDVISVRERSRKNAFFKNTEENIWNQMPWVSVDAEKLQGRILSEPMRDNIDYPIEETQIVELYSK